MTKRPDQSMDFPKNPTRQEREKIATERHYVVLDIIREYPQGVSKSALFDRMKESYPDAKNHHLETSLQFLIMHFITYISIGRSGIYVDGKKK
jgi:hypothetical protein